MPEIYRVLKQTNPSAASLTDSYLVPANTSVILSGINVANRGTATSFRISIAIAGAADSDEQYLAYDEPIADNGRIVVGKGVTLAATDLVRVYATLATLSFNVSGVEIT